MKSNRGPLRPELTVIGSGTAGMAASLFALNRNIKTVQISFSETLQLSSGMMDLMGAEPFPEKGFLKDPWPGIEKISNRADSPFAKIRPDEIKSAFSEVLDFLRDNGLPYSTSGGANSMFISPAGTVRATYACPETMKKGVQAFNAGTPALIIGFRGYKEFSARQIKETLSDKWPQLSSTEIDFPGYDGRRRLYSLHMARALDSPEERIKLAEKIKKELKSQKAVGIPAVAGTVNTGEALAHLENLLGADVFEIPTLPFSVPGYRLQQAFSSGLAKKGLAKISGSKIISASYSEGDGFILSSDGPGESPLIISRYLILATGRFSGGGLESTRHGIKESILNLPLAAPASRELWHNADFFGIEGHPVNRAGIITDSSFSPAGTDGKKIYDGLYAAGSILAGHDWMRTKSGSGLAFSSAFKAVNSIRESGA